MSTTTRLASLAAFALLSTGCAPLQTHEPTPSRSPSMSASPQSACAGATSAAIWSSETTSTRFVTYDDSGREVGKVDVDVKGLPPVGSLEHRGDSFFAIANGDSDRSTTHIVEFNPAECSATTHEVPGVLLLDLNVSDTDFYITHTLNAEAHVYRVPRDGGEPTEARFPGSMASHLALWDGVVLVVTTNDASSDNPTTTLRALDRRSLDEEWSLDLPMRVGLGSEALV
ncbi:MAG: hypothetical protein Q4G35_13995, partial [Propionibacteriaceae bacterium]|nr:hypothetical protein [Propionibacteriaceae bacterium]